MKAAEIWFSLFLLIVALVMFIVGLTYPYETQYGPGPGFLPVWVSGLTVLFTAILILTMLRKENEGKFFISKEGLKKYLIFISLLVAAILLTNVLGLMLSLGLFSLVIFKYIEKYNWKKSLSVSFGTMFVLFIIFKLWLRIPTPSGLFFL